MMNGITKLIIFTAGAVIGSAVTWKLVKDKYERIANEEIKSVKERYSKKTAKDSDTDELDDVSLADTIKEVEEYLNKIDESGYSTEIKEKGGAKSMKNDRPYIIAPEEFDDQPDYDAVSLTYYEDGVVTDMWDEKIDDDEVEDQQHHHHEAHKSGYAIPWVEHPKWVAFQKHVAHRTTADGCHETYGVGSKPVKFFHGG